MIKIYSKDREKICESFTLGFFQGRYIKSNGVAVDGALAAVYSSDGKALGVGHFQMDRLLSDCWNSNRFSFR